MTLIEVMIALVVTTVGLLGALAVVGVSVKGANFSRSTTEASVLAQSKLEQKVSLPVGATTDTAPANETEYFDVNGVSTAQASAYFTRSTFWTLGVNGGKARQLSVSVTWTDVIPRAVWASRIQDLQ